MQSLNLVLLALKVVFAQGRGNGPDCGRVLGPRSARSRARVKIDHFRLLGSLRQLVPSSLKILRVLL